MLAADVLPQGPGRLIGTLVVGVLASALSFLAGFSVVLIGAILNKIDR